MSLDCHSHPYWNRHGSVRAARAPVITDPDQLREERRGEQSVADEENGIAWPAVYVVGRDGKIAWRSLTENYTKRPASAEIVAALDALKP